VVPANEFPRGFVASFSAHSAPVTPFDIPTGALRAPGTNGVSFVMQAAQTRSQSASTVSCGNPPPAP